MNKLESFAINTLRVIIERDEKYKKINQDLLKLNPNFPHYIRMMDDECFTAIFKLLDEVLPDTELASYFFFECLNMKNGGSITIKDKKTLKERNFKLKTINDLIYYIENKD